MNKKQKNRKNVTQNKRNRIINRRYRSTVRTLSTMFVKKVQKINTTEKGLKENSKLEVKKIMNKLFSIIDKSVKKGIIHKNNAARRKAVISSISNQL